MTANRSASKISKIDRAADLMRTGSVLVQMHNANSIGWYLVPGGEVLAKVAGALLERPDVQPSNDGLFPVFPKPSNSRGAQSCDCAAGEINSSACVRQTRRGCCRRRRDQSRTGSCRPRHSRVLPMWSSAARSFQDRRRHRRAMTAPPTTGVPCAVTAPTTMRC